MGPSVVPRPESHPTDGLSGYLAASCSRERALAKSDHLAAGTVDTSAVNAATDSTP